MSASEEFDVTFAAALARPWVSSRILPGLDDPVYDQIASAQLFNLGRAAEARTFAERAFGRLPDSQEAAVHLVEVCLALGDYRKASEVLTPFLTGSQAVRYEVYSLAGEALLKSGDFATAVAVLDQAVSHFGLNAALLNALGDAYRGLGKREEALASYEKSLQLSPDQPQIKKKADELRQKK